MDDDGGGPQRADLVAGSATVLVNGDGDEPLVQSWPCIHIASPSVIPQAVKEVYSRLAASAKEVDQGIPDLLVSLIGSGNSFGLESSSKYIRGLSRLVGQCDLWVVSSGEQSDPLAAVLGRVFRSALSQRNNPAETLLIVANDGRCVRNSTAASTRMINSSFNTLYILLKDRLESATERALFRSRVALKLASPPPALLIGVPEERSPYSAAQTPMSFGGGPAIILSNLATYRERKPLSVGIFCGGDLEALEEMRELVECGCPVLVVQDSSELCAILRSAATLYRTPGFDHQRFVGWLRKELRSLSSVGGDLQRAVGSVSTILSCAFGSHSLLGFVAADEVENLADRLLDLLADSVTDPADLRRILELAVKLGAAAIVKRMNVENAVGRENIGVLLEGVLASDHSVPVLSALLDQNIPIVVNATLLANWFDSLFDKYFFQSIVLGTLLGYTDLPDRFDRPFFVEINSLLCELSGGISNLFPPDSIFGLTTLRSQSYSINLLAIWALLLNQTEHVKCLVAYSPEPIGLSIVLAKIARSLARESKEWFFFERQLQSLSSALCRNAQILLTKSFAECPLKAYNAICYQSETFNRLTLPQLAYETNTREIIAHECCQRWTLRLLYGNLQILTITKIVRLPNWLKIILSAILIFPIRFWVSRRPAAISRRSGIHPRPVSPTVALLESSNRAFGMSDSLYSQHSVRSNPYFKDDFMLAASRETTPLDDEVMIAEPETPRSANFMPSQIIPLEDVESAYSHGPMNDREIRFSRQTNVPPTFFPQQVSAKKPNPQKRKRKAGLNDLFLFYSTPIVKYWLSLVFRLLYLGLFAYLLVQPSCGDPKMELLLWFWSFSWLIEGLWVLSVRLRTSSASQMGWRIFDLFVIFVFLFVLFTLRFFGPMVWKSTSPKLEYVLKVAWAAFLIYQCYTTLFVFVPASEILGPFLVRIKLMIIRDFSYFAVLIALVELSSVVAIKAIVFPDRAFGWDAAVEIFGWTWLSFFTTDLSRMEETEQCTRMSITDNRQLGCRAVGGYTDPHCPAQGIPAAFAIYQFLFVLKVISWPILFALFSRTAKKVDEEADMIWKYQLYSLAVDFSLRPFLPPPFTVLFLVFFAVRRMTGYISERSEKLIASQPDHPDARSARNATRKLSSRIYRNSAAPPSKAEIHRMFWGNSAISHWKSEQSAKAEKSQHRAAEERRLAEKLQLLVITHSFERTQAAESATVGDHGRLHVEDHQRGWNVLIPDYSPPTYSQPVAEFPIDVQMSVERPENIVGIGKYWRQLQLQRHINGDPTQERLLSVEGFPLNPFGRTGLAGRNKYVKFGSNMIYFYVIMAKTPNGTVVLINGKNELPKKWKHGGLRSDEFLSEILTALGAPDADIQRFSTRSHMVVGEVESRIAHVCVSPLETVGDTDNAWTEADRYLQNFLMDINGDPLPTQDFKTDVSSLWKNQWKYYQWNDSEAEFRHSEMISKFKIFAV